MATKGGIKSRNVDGTSMFVLNPIRKTDAYSYGLRITGDDLLRGTTATKSYVVQIDGDRSSSYVATGDSNDALLRVSGNNYAANDSNFIMRGINVSINNRSGGTMARMENSLGTQGKSGGTVPTILGLMITAENYGTCATTFGGVDILLKNEAAVATTEFGLRIRNENNSVSGPVDSVFNIYDTGANTGFTHLFTLLDAGMPAQSTCSTVSAIGTKGWIKIKVGSATRYIGLSESVS